MHNFKELKIWQRSMDWVEQVYKATLLFPNEEKYGLAQQVRKCAVSVPGNISEGAGRATNPQFKFFLEIAMGSCNVKHKHRLNWQEDLDILVTKLLRH